MSFDKCPSLKIKLDYIQYQKKEILIPIYSNLKFSAF